MTQDHFTYRVTWSPETGSTSACARSSRLFRGSPRRRNALAGIRRLVADVVRDMTANGEKVPEPIADRTYSGEFKVRIPPQAHRALVIQAAEQGVSLNRLASAKLCA